MSKYEFLITYAPPYQLMDWLHFPEKLEELKEMAH